MDTRLMRIRRRGSVMSDVPSETLGTSSDAESEVSMVVAYRHDVHKLRGRSHGHAADQFRGVRVNESVPLGADGDAALLSRPRGRPRDTLPARESWRRVPLLAGAEAVLADDDDNVGDVGDAGAVGAAIEELVASADSVALHEAWLGAVVPALVSESVYFPTTSVKYHTLLVAALLDNHRAGDAFEELWLAVTSHDPGEAATVVPHRTVLVTPWFAVHVTAEPGDWPAARLGDVPARSFADVWARLPEVPFDVDRQRRWRVLDAQLRRIRAWSTALQYIEAFTAALDSTGSGTPVVGWSA
jgi:hypothetical protein